MWKDREKLQKSLLRFGYMRILKIIFKQVNLHSPWRLKKKSPTSSTKVQRMMFLGSTLKEFESNIQMKYKIQVVQLLKIVDTSVS